jgi:hypothetical protein
VVERGHEERAAIAREETLRLEPLERLAHGRTRHAERLGELGFHQSVAGPEPALVEGPQDEGVGVARGLHGGRMRAEGPAIKLPPPVALP